MQEVFMKAKKLISAGLAMVLAASFTLTGCGMPNSDAVVATLGDKEITYGVANLYAQYQATMYDAYYLSYYGDDMWSQDLSGSGSTMEEEVKSNVLDSIEEFYRLDEHASDYGIELTDDDMEAIDQAADAFIDANSSKALKKLGATDKDDVVELLRLLTVETKVYNAIIAETDVTVTDEDAACRTFSYVTIDTTGTTDDDGNTVAYTDDELASIKSDAANLASSAASGDFDTVMSDAGDTVSTYSYAADEDTMDEAVISAADALSEGEVSGVIETDDALYILRLDSAYDADASATHKEELISDQQQAHYEDVYSGYQEESDFTVNEKVWNKVNFDNLFSLVETDTSGDASSDASANASGSATASGDN